MGSKRNSKAPGRAARSAEALGKLSTAIALVQTIALAMRTREDEPDLGAIATSLDVAVFHLGAAHGDVELALRGVTP